MKKPKLLDRIGYFLKRSENPTSMIPGEWIARGLYKDEAYVVQIGSNDGKTRDPIFALMKERKAWRGLFVEPVPYLFERLKKNYQTLDRPSRFRFHNGAINDGSGQLFYYVDTHAKYVIPGLPEWFDQIGSFDKRHILSHMDGILEPFIITGEIQGMTFHHLVQSFQITEIDILHIDAEGYDWKILCQVDLKKWQPAVILYEYKHLKEADINASLTRLMAQYDIFRFKNDFLCFHRDKHTLSKTDLNFLRRDNGIK